MGFDDDEYEYSMDDDTEKEESSEQNDEAEEEEEEEPVNVKRGYSDRERSMIEEWLKKNRPHSDA